MNYFLIGLYIFSFIFQILLTIYNKKSDKPKRLLTHISTTLTLIAFLLINIFMDIPLEISIPIIIITIIWVCLFIYFNIKVLDEDYEDELKNKDIRNKKS